MFQKIIIIYLFLFHLISCCIKEEYNSSFDSWLEKVDLTIVFDIGDYNRIGCIGDIVYGHCKSVSIDHHPAKENHPFYLNIVSPTAPATGYMIWKYFKHTGFANNTLSTKIASALYASVVTDTGSFKYQSTTSDTHYMAAHLLEIGVKGYDIQKSI